MKKFILLLILLVPFFGFSQTVDLVSWNGPSDLKPTLLNDYISAENFSGAGITGPAASWNGFLGSSWPTGGRDNAKYFQIAVNQTLDGSFNLREINFSYQGTSSVYHVRYSMNANFSSPTILATNAADPNNNVTPVDITGLNIPVTGGQTIYIRFYAYNGGGNWNIMNGIKLKGTVTAPNRLSGDYIVGSASGAKFNTLTAAVRALNNLGVKGNTNLILDNTTYSRASNEIFPIVINNYAGNETYKVTIKPNTGKTVTIEGTSEYNWISNPTVFKVNGTDNLVFDGSNTANGTTKDLTIYNNNPLNETSKSVIWVASENGANGANKNTFKNLILKHYSRNGNTSYGIFSGGTNNLGDASDAGNSENTVQNVAFTKVGQPVFVNSGNNASTNWKIQNNTIGGNADDNKPFLGIYLNNATSYEISGNSIVGLLKNTTSYSPVHSGIIISGTSNGIIFKNTISDISNTTNNTYCTAIYLDSGNNTVYNNIISNVRGNGGDGNSNVHLRGHGIFVNSGANNQILFNTVVMNDATNSDGRASALYLAGGTNITLRNNIFYNRQTSGSQYAIYSTVATSQITSDYNDLHAPIIGYSGGANASTFANWKTATSKDANSKNIAPVFDANLRLNQTNANNLLLVGLQVSPAITTDRFDVNRYKPTIGSEEIKCVAQGDQTTFGNGEWIGYVYSNYTANTLPAPVAVANNADYQGFVKEDAIFNTTVANGLPFRGGKDTKLCDAPTERFFVRYKMKMTLTAGKYNFTVGGDDGYRLKIDGQLVTTINNWGEHSYTTNSVVKIMEAKEYTFEIEYYNGPNLAQVSFTYGKIEGDPTVFGDNVWNVYGYLVENINVDANNTSYAGYFVDPALGIDSENRWPIAGSPSAAVAVPATGATGWGGIPIGPDNFTVVHKRKGFPCGLYEIKIDKFDDEVRVILDGNVIFERNGYSPTANVIVGTYNLNTDSKMEVRLREGGGSAYIKMTLTNKQATYNNGAWDVDPVNKATVVNSDLLIENDLTVCSCTVKAGKKITINADKALNVIENVIVETGGNILVKNNGSLVQIKDYATFTGDVNSFTMERNTTSMVNNDYTYWSSPVAAQKLATFSPLTSTTKFYLFDGTNWANVDNNSSMIKGRGYIIRAPQSWSNTITNGGTSNGNTYTNGTFQGGVFQGLFKGVANSGDVNVALLGSIGSSNLLGNPYASPISVSEFMNANAGKTDGNFYFWTHKTPASRNPNSNGQFVYADSDYAMLNKTGGTASSPIVPKPSANIASGQGFFVNTKATNTNVVFKNSMRIQGGEKNKEFYRTSSQPQDDKYWISISNGTAYNEFLIGYIEGATNEMEDNFDGISYSDGSATLYTIIDGNKLAIQGRQAPFNNADIVPVGYKAATAGQFTISINKKEGAFENGQTIYIYDKTTNEYHDLSAGDFIFNSVAGTFDSRFEMRYVNETLGIDTPAVSNSDIIVYKSGNQIAVKAKNFSIEGVQVYDINGKSLFTKKAINNTEFSTSGLNIATQVLVVKVTLDGGQTVTKKVIMN